jgi:signal transduction histidine kinase
MTEKSAISGGEEKIEIAVSNSQEMLVSSIVALERFQIEIRGVSGRVAMLALTMNHLQSLLPIHMAGFFFPNSSELDFSLETSMEPDDAQRLTHLVDQSIESGVFGWALKHMRPAAFKSPDGRGHLILGALRTRQRVLGMFAAILDPAPKSGWDANMTVMATYLTCAADAIFSEELTAQLQEHNRKLDFLVRQRTQQLEAAKDAAEVANRAKDTFLATISHELRTPLNAILGYSQRLRQNRNLLPPQAEQMETIHNSAEYLLTLINDLLDLAKAEASHIELYPSRIELRSMAREIVSIVQHRAEEKRLTFRCVIETMAPDMIEADSKRLRQILINLLGNAVKFTNKGSVELRISRHGELLRFCVTDTGSGIDPKFLPQLGMPFHQLGDPSQRAGGSGLGLAITKKLIQTMGSDLKVQSQVGQGSVFWFELQCDPSVAALPEMEIFIGEDARKEGAPLDPARLQIVRELVAGGDVVALQRELEKWAADSQDSDSQASRLLELAKGFRIKSIKQLLNL